MARSIPSWLSRSTVTALRSAVAGADPSQPGEHRERCHWAILSALDELHLDPSTAPDWLRRAALEHSPGGQNFGPLITSGALVGGGSGELWDACGEVQTAVAELPGDASERLILRLSSEFGLPLSDVADLLDEAPEWIEDMAVSVSCAVARVPRVRAAIGMALVSVGAVAGMVGDEDDAPRRPRRRPDADATAAPASSSAGLLSVVGFCLLALAIGVVVWAWPGGDAPPPNMGAAVNADPAARPAPEPAVRPQTPVAPRTTAPATEQPATPETPVAGPPVDQPVAPAVEPAAAPAAAAPIGPPPDFSDPDGLLPGERVWGRVTESPDKWTFPTFYEDLEAWGDPRLVARKTRHPDGSLREIRAVIPGAEVLCGPSREFFQGAMFDYAASLERESVKRIVQHVSNRATGRGWTRSKRDSDWAIWDYGIDDNCKPYLGATDNVIETKRAMLPRLQEVVPGSGRLAPEKDSSPAVPSGGTAPGGSSTSGARRDE